MRETNKLSDLKCRRAAPGVTLSDGGGLFLRCTSSGTKSWIWRYRAGDRVRDHGLGAYPVVTLSEARQKVAELRRERHAGQDPIDARRAVQPAPVPSLRQMADVYITSHRAGWSDRHAIQWTSSLALHVYPILGDLPVDAVDTAQVMRVLDPLWATTTETASRVRARIESILDYAKSRGSRDGENPARWRGHVENMLPSRKRVQPTRHFAAMSYAQIPDFMAELQRRQSLAAIVVRFVILTACRLGEVRGMVWSEVDLNTAVWTIPAARMKGRKLHRVPLSVPAMEILHQMHEVRTNDLVFSVTGRQFSTSTPIRLLRDMGRTETVHGFRSAFSTWGSETGQPRDLIELSLAHQVGNVVERSYQRSDLLERRRPLLDAWAKFCTG